MYGTLGRSLTLAASPGVRSSTDVQTIFGRVGNKAYDTVPNLVNPRWECADNVQKNTSAWAVATIIWVRAGKEKSRL
jgi:hypothetical protein